MRGVSPFPLVVVVCWGSDEGGPVAFSGLSPRAGSLQKKPVEEALDFSYFS